MSLTQFVRYYLVFSALAITALIIMVVVLLFRVDNTVQQQHNQALQGCQQNNVNRQQDIAIWNRLLTVSSPPSAAARAEIAELKHLVLIKDTPHTY